MKNALEVFTTSISPILFSEAFCVQLVPWLNQWGILFFILCEGYQSSSLRSKSGKYRSDSKYVPWRKKKILRNKIVLHLYDLITQSQENKNTTPNKTKIKPQYLGTPGSMVICFLLRASSYFSILWRTWFAINI